MDSEAVFFHFAETAANSARAAATVQSTMHLWKQAVGQNMAEAEFADAFKAKLPIRRRLGRGDGKIY